VQYCDQAQARVLGVYHRLGGALVALGNTEEAIAAFREVIRIKPELGDV
jgi:hypothetical protein